MSLLYTFHRNVWVFAFVCLLADSAAFMLCKTLFGYWSHFIYKKNYVLCRGFWPADTTGVSAWFHFRATYGLLLHRIDVAEHALYRTRKANLEVLLGMSHYRTYFDYQQNICSWHHLLSTWIALGLHLGNNICLCPNTFNLI